MTIVIFLILTSSCLAVDKPINSFTGGRGSPLMEQRTDFEKYDTLSRQMENMLPFPQGTANKRPGTKLINASPVTSLPVDGAYPMLHELDASEIPTKPTAPTIADGTTPVADATDLQAMSGSGSYILTADIDLDGVSWTPISNFTGTLDGDGYTISNLTLTDESYTYEYANASSINTGTDRIYLASTHTWNTGQKVISYFGSGTPATPLAPWRVYYIIKIDTRYIKLATTYANAIAGTAIDITAQGTARIYLEGGAIAGLFDNVLGGAKFKDLTLDGFSIANNSYGNKGTGGLIGRGYIDGADDIVVLNCHIQNSTLEKGYECGGLIGKFESEYGATSAGGFKVFQCTGTNNTITYGSGLIGELDSFHNNSNASSVVDCYTTGGAVNDPGRSGGLFGEIYGDYEDSDSWVNIHSCWSDVPVTSVTFSAGDRAGGLGGTVQGVYITSCYSTGDIDLSYGTNGYSAVGGFLGNIGQYDSGRGKIINCYSTGDVLTAGSSYWIGGFIGKSDSDDYILRCYSTGNVTVGDNAYSVGGFIGFWDGTLTNDQQTDFGIERCWSTGDVTQNWTFHSGNGIGGFVGEIYKWNMNYPNAAIKNCYAWGSVTSNTGTWESDVDTNHGVGGFVGAADSGVGLGNDILIQNCYCAQTEIRTGSGYTDQISYKSGVSGGFTGVNQDQEPLYDVYYEDCFFDTDTCGFTDDDSTAGGHETCWMWTKDNYEAAGWAFSAVDQVKGTINDIWYMPDAGDVCNGGAGGGAGPEDAIRLIPFEYSTDDAYVLAFGTNVLSFYRNSAEIQQ